MEIFEKILAINFPHVCQKTALKINLAEFLNAIEKQSRKNLMQY